VEIRCYIDFQDGGCCSAILLPVYWFRIGWHSSLEKARVCQQTKFRSYSWIHIWVLTPSDLEKQTSAILKFYFQFRFRLHHRSRHVSLHLAAKFHQIGPSSADIWCYIYFQDGIHWSGILLSVLDWVTPLSSIGPCLSANQIS